MPPPAAALAVACLAAVVSLIGASRVSLWSDEVATISAAERSPSDLARLLDRMDAVHGLYYAAMHAWIRVFGAAPLSIRAASALAVAVGAAGVVVLGRRLANIQLGAVAGVVFALLPRVTWAGIEARSWAATLALAVWATVTLHVATTRPERRWWILYGVLVAVGVATNIYVALLLVAHGLTLLLAARDRLWRWLLSAVVGVLAASGVVYLSMRQSSQLGAERLSPLGLVRNVVVNQWFLGETPTRTTTTGTAIGGWGDAWKAASVVLAVVAWCLVGVAIARRTRTRRVVLAWTLPWLVAPTVMIVAAAQVNPNLYNPRYLTFCAPALALLLGSGLRALGRRLLIVGAVILLVAALPVVASQRTVLAKSSSDLALVADYLSAHARPGDAVYYGPRDDATDGRVYRSLRTVAIGYPASVTGLDDVTLLASPAAGTNLFGTSATLAASADHLEGHSTLWVVRRLDRPAEAAQDDDLLEQAGFHAIDTWVGSQSEVVEMRR